MESYDPAKAAQIWTRVHGGKNDPPPGSELLPLIGQTLSAAAAYLQLSRQLQGKEAAAARKLYEEALSCAGCLKGIHILTAGEAPPAHTPTAAPAPADILLRRCYGQEMRALAQYERRCGDGEYGPVFALLAKQAGAHCRTILELLGKLGTKQAGK